MKVGIIGAGNMGGAIARGLAQGHYVREQDIIVTNPSMPKLDALKAEFPAIQVSTNNREASDADVVIVAVKPWKMEEVLKPLRLRQPQILVSVAAGLTFENLAHFVADDVELVQRNGACHADRRKAICGGHIAHLVRHCIRAEICASRHASRSGIGHPPERRDEDGGSNGRRSRPPFACQ